jgi:hypothetical protein
MTLNNNKKNVVSFHGTNRNECELRGSEFREGVDNSEVMGVPKGDDIEDSQPFKKHAQPSKTNK